MEIAVIVGQAALPPEIYWKRMLPDVDMPPAVMNSLPTPGIIQGVGVHSRRAGRGHTDVDVNALNGVGVDTAKEGKGGAKVGVNMMKGVEVNAGTKQKPVYVHVHPGFNPFDYRYPHKGQAQNNDPGRSLFFLEKDMKPRHLMSLHFTKTTNAATFLPRDVAKSLPFSSSKLSAILKEFLVEPNTEEAKVIEETIKGCEEKGIQGEEKYCTTSLESLIDYVKNTLGKNVKAMSTDARNVDDKVQKYTISSMGKVADDNQAIVCHKQRYAYAVFYCHKSKGTSAYMVSLMSGSGSTFKTMAICHRDTSAWNPKHLAFQVLNVKPGSAPICHFLPEDHIVWVSK
ncbi:BURP domain protein RD22 [Beta vulgaris subsp. vulgaris]|uniref:BURP domain protein RD22 n=1 Tax=Beta vulgaris subsp. vulgaris TaxID=3555 RepID=UPI0025495397|nr:BURP domain protein RD22 [Beta vulgaris subsp. vulgaris]